MNLRTQNSSTTSKKYYLYKKPLHALTDSALKNIFSLTRNQQQYSEVADSRNHSLNSRQYSEMSLSLSSSPSKLVQPSKQLVLPILSESKYMTRKQEEFFGYSVPIKQKKKTKRVDMSMPKYLLDMETIDGRNIKKMRAYNKKWYKMIDARLQRNSTTLERTLFQTQKKQIINPEQVSLLKHSVRKSQVYEQMHDRQLPERRRRIQFEFLLRDQDKIIKENMKQKGIRAKNIQPIKGKGGDVRPLFQQMFMVEQVYRFDKNGKNNTKQPHKLKNAYNIELY